MRAKYTKEELRERLSCLANVPPIDPATDPNWNVPALKSCIDFTPASQQFIKKYGPLRLHQDSLLAEQEIPEYARRFREAWNVRTEFDIQTVNGLLQEIFRAGDPISGERGVRADFATGLWEPMAGAGLLDWLALELMRSRKMLHRCERPECGRYFVKNFSRDRYCTIQRQWERELDRVGDCSDVMRRRNQTASAERKSKRKTTGTRKRSRK